MHDSTSIRTLFPTPEDLGEPPLDPHEDLSRILVISVPEGADPSEHVPAHARYGLTSTYGVDGPGQSRVRDRWQREPDRPCSTIDGSCSHLVRCLNGRGPCGEPTRIGMGYLERLMEEVG